VLKKSADRKAIFLWDGDALLGDTNLQATVPTSSPVTREWVYFPGTFEPLVMIQEDISKDVFFYHNDPNGAPTRLSKITGEVTWAASYTALGGISRLDSGRFANPIRLKGQFYDDETGLAYNRYRYFDETLGSFVSQDPLGLGAGDNIYRYAPNVFSWKDPLGLSCDLDKLSKSGAAASSKPGLTRAGHSLTKHGAGKRAGSSIFPDPKGGPSDINKKAQELLDDILTDPKSAIKQRTGKGGDQILQVHRPDGAGAIFKSDSTGEWVFSHFGENLY
jgi:RHS repeat-associated protein